ncbi:Tox-REase-5 domain-containing protein [Hyalangium gracile]|uniref:Tox-REase-5 domain-containing protein n=1 Tax=Hyalangium gracile TaxID=394092 RepID=UPI001CC90382|nr:Tox-REase-5 domain-containing protein [Hyalangium gracile]
MLLLSLACACATGPEGPRSLDFGSASARVRQDRRASFRSAPAPSRGELGPIEARLLDTDYFFGLLVRAGVPPSELPDDRSQLSPEDATRLMNLVLAADVPLRDFGPWRMAAQLLLEVMESTTPVPRQRLHERMRRFAPLLVLRPDGCLVRATTGKPVQRIGEVRFDKGALRAEGFEVGPFYLLRQRFLYPVDGSLEIHPDTALAGVYAPDEGTLGPLVEGAGQAVIDNVVGIVSLVLHQLDSLEGLARLPSAVRLLLENSPQYYAHFQELPHGEQVRIVSKLLTNVALVCGTAGAGTSRALSAGSKLGRLRVPVLSLSGQGALAFSRVAIPVDRMVTAVSAAPGALYILHMASGGAGGEGGGQDGASWKPPPGGPGQWVRKGEGMSARARRYQSQVTGAPEDWVYRVERAGEKFDFDGFKESEGVLVDAKGPGYDNKFGDTFSPEYWFKDTGAQELVANAQRQLRVANGVPIRWYVAEAKAAQAIRRLLHNNRCNAIEIVHVPAQQ